MGIEPTSLAWEARVMPLYDAREDCWFPTLSDAGRASCKRGPRLHFTATDARMTNLSLDAHNR